MLIFWVVVIAEKASNNEKKFENKIGLVGAFLSKELFGNVRQII